ncbi:metallopeptidase MepB [Cryphonectria parasitica EP155]|uniref:Metallopeptidase MepB n=1 Tax=Cryphonectria parasitica (strain ATCC 38755 / EP155) TaxID=660469 RepID=A0A9P4XWA6_CRYP1|nr:metallopeptidase MepB [Cryphonectria parasitica EP155]KAF3761950.1 metallopeptidase MepB [Cryphonectria parasitica EP155]
MMIEHGVPPQLPLLFDPTPENVLRDARKTITATTAEWDKIVETVLPSQATVENTIIPIAHLENETMAVNDVIYLMATTHPDKGIREACKAAKKLTDEAAVDRYLRKDMFALVDAVLSTTTETSVKPETYRFLTKHHAEFAENGCDLEGSAKTQFENDLKRLESLKRDYISNLDNDTSGMWFSLEELDGLPKTFIDALKKGDEEQEGKYWVDMKKPRWERMLKFARCEETRMHYFIQHLNRIPSNIPLAREIVLVRDSLARQKGSKSWAQLRMSNKMMNDPAAVRATLSQIQRNLFELGQKEASELLALKKSDVQSKNNDDTQLFLWDISYYNNLRQEKTRSVDTKSIMEYFELMTVIRHILELYSRLFEIEFELVTEERAQTLHGENSPKMKWQEEVFLYAVWDLKSTPSFIGYMYFDLHPREGKYSHAGHFNLQKGFERRDGTRAYPCSALIMNQAKPTGSDPSLLSANEVRSLFHEVGHGIHNLLSVTTFARFHGTRVDRDFVETPSILFEYFLWTPERLREVSQHYSYVSPEYKDAWKSRHPDEQDVPPQRLPDHLIQAVLSTSTSTLSILRTLHFALYDMAVHDPPSAEALASMDLCTTYNKLWWEIVGVHGGEALAQGRWDWAHGESSVRLLMAGRYDAGYYAYTLGRMWALDIFDTYFREDTYNKDAARKYRELLLKPGSSQPEWKTLTNYLGREPRPEPLYRWLGAASS